MAGPQLAFTTRGVAVPSRQRALRALAEHGLLPVVPLDGHLPRVDLVKWRLPGASVLWGSFAGVRQVGDAGSGGGAADELFFGINVAGAGLARQRGQQVAVEAGDAVVVDLRDGAFTVERPYPSRLVGVRLPSHRVTPEPRRGDDRGLRLVRGDAPAVQLLTRYLRSARAAPVPSSAQLADAFVAHVTDLVALSLGAAGTEPWRVYDGSVRVARLHAVKADIEQHLTDGSLSAAAVAARLGVSTRYLHKLFEHDTTTYSRFVLDRRLDLAYRRLRDPRYAVRTISAIACDAGFGDLSYFNRTFRRRYDVTPSELRRAAQAPAVR
jgi:AraC-like DNA-binding protein